MNKKYENCAMLSGPATESQLRKPLFFSSIMSACFPRKNPCTCSRFHVVIRKRARPSLAAKYFAPSSFQIKALTGGGFIGSAKSLVAFKRDIIQLALLRKVRVWGLIAGLGLRDQATSPCNATSIGCHGAHCDIRGLCAPSRGLCY